MTNSQNYHDLAAQFASNPIEEREIEAKLSIAYEQRTANLIALFQRPSVTVKNTAENTTKTWSLYEHQLSDVLEQIMERLGLDK